MLTSRGGLFRYPTRSASCKTQARYDSASPPLRPPIAPHTWNSSLSPEDQMLRTVSSASSLIRSPALSVNAVSPTSREASRQAQREREQKERAASRQGRSEHRARVLAGTRARHDHARESGIGQGGGSAQLRQLPALDPGAGGQNAADTEREILRLMESVITEVVALASEPELPATTPRGCVRQDADTAHGQEGGGGRTQRSQTSAQRVAGACKWVARLPAET